MGLPVAGRFGDCVGLLGDLIIAEGSEIQEIGHLSHTGYHYHDDFSKLVDLGSSSSPVDFGKQNNSLDTIFQTHRDQIYPQSDSALRSGIGYSACCLT